MYLGPGYQKMYVIFNGHVIADFTLDQGVRAAALQFSLLYIFGVDYEKGKNAKKYKDFFDFCSTFLWKIRTKYLSSGTGKPILKRVSNDAKKLWTDISTPTPSDT